MDWEEPVSGDKSKQDNETFGDDVYPPFRANKSKNGLFATGISLNLVFWVVGIVAAIAFVLVLGSMVNGKDESARIADLEAKINALEARLEKIDDVDEKVTRIWEQAKAFETFKTRFDRTEASMSLRMDHIAMSLDALQKKSNENIQKLKTLEKAAKKTSPPSKKRSVTKKRKSAKTHVVAKGETLYRISQKYRLSLGTLRSLNNLQKNDVIQVGQVLVVKK